MENQLNSELQIDVAAIWARELERFEEQQVNKEFYDDIYQKLQKF